MVLMALSTSSSELQASCTSTHASRRSNILTELCFEEPAIEIANPSSRNLFSPTSLGNFHSNLKELQIMAGNNKACLQRLQKEYKQLIREPVPQILAHPSSNNILEWHYCLLGVRRVSLAPHTQPLTLPCNPSFT